MMQQKVSLSMLLVTVLVAKAMATEYVVNDQGTGDFPTIQAAIDGAQSGDTIWLADGTFTGPGNRDISYDRKAVTIASMSGNPEDCVLDAGGSEADPHRHFFFRYQEGAASRLEGVRLQRAYHEGGGSIRCEEGSNPTIVNCVFDSNHSTWGGGIFCNESSPTVLQCRFTNNETEHPGAGAACYMFADPVFEDCAFVGNVAGSCSGGLDCQTYCEPIITRCCFVYNEAEFSAGATGAVWGSNPVYSECVFVGNTSPRGGAMDFGIDSYPQITSCTFYSNGSPQGGCIFTGGTCQVTVENCILSFSTEGRAIYCYDPNVAPILSCCDIYGNAGGDWVKAIEDQRWIRDNLCTDPLFCDAGAEDFQLFDTSPCIGGPCEQVGALPVGCFDPQSIEEPLPGPLSSSAELVVRTHPNPFSEEVLISASYPSSSQSPPKWADLYDAAGRFVRRLVIRERSEQEVRFIWDGLDRRGTPVSPGIYHARISADRDIATVRLVRTP